MIQNADKNYNTETDGSHGYEYNDDDTGTSELFAIDIGGGRGIGRGQGGGRGGGGGPESSIYQRKSMDGQRQMVSDHLTTKMHKLTKFTTDKLPQINKSQLEKIKQKQKCIRKSGKN